jgi:hypothetical protein
MAKIYGYGLNDVQDLIPYERDLLHDMTKAAIEEENRR